MKPTMIPDILDIAYEGRKQGRIINPLFEGHAGLGKSDLIKQWVKNKRKENPDFGYVDFRLAYYEGPDFVGYPDIFEVEVVVNGEKMTVKKMTHCLPDFWPTEGEGLFLFEEPNRGNPMVMNALMQILTDRVVGTNYTVPEGWIMAGAQNQATSEYNTNPLDVALADRFDIYQIDYDYIGFLSYIKANDWHPPIVNMVESAIWLYKTPDKIGKDEKYISPRSLSKLNNNEKAGNFYKNESRRELHLQVCQSVLGKAMGNEYWRLCWDDAPVLARDLITDRSAALKKLTKESTAGENYAGDKIGVTVESIIQDYQGYYDGLTNAQGDKVTKDGNLIDEETMIAVAKIIPADHAVNLVKACTAKLVSEYGGNRVEVLKSLVKRNPDCIKILKGVLQTDRIKKD